VTQERRAEPAAPPPRKTRNLYLWAFLIGIATITLLRPLTRRIPDPPPVLGQLPSWSLSNRTGGAFGSPDVEGRVWVASFFSTACGTTCDDLMDAMGRLADRYDDEGVDVRLVSVSVDPANDTVEGIAEYARAQGAESTRWSVLTGEPGAVRALVEDGFGMELAEPSAKEPPETEGDAPPVATTRPHTAQLVLVDGLGQIRGYYEVLGRELYPGFRDSIEVGIDEVYHRSRHVLKEAE
jgi:protein SCO1/2